MKFLGTCVFLLSIFTLLFAQRTELDSGPTLEILRGVRQWILKTFGTPGPNGARFMNRAKAAAKLQKPIPDEVPFPCDVSYGRSPEVPMSPHKLRPGDIDVIAAMGDSLTAGNGIFATEFFQLFLENRGASAPGGGQGSWREYLTLPNILKEFNPKLIGYALGDSTTLNEASQLNVAEPGAMSRDMPFMADVLISKIKKDPRINLEKDWKLITLSIGSNDICADICVRPSPWDAIEEHKSDILTTLRKLRDNLPRTVVILSIPPHTRALVDARQGFKSLKCYTLTTMECPCLLALQYENKRSEYYRLYSKWQALDEEITRYPEFDRDNFTLVLTKCQKHISIPKHEDGSTDMSFFSFDCFHASQKANAWYANCLWNTLVDSYGRKPETWSPPFEQFLCPKRHHPYLITSRNTLK